MDSPLLFHEDSEERGHGLGAGADMEFVVKGDAVRAVGWLTDPADAGNTRGDNIRSFNDGGGESGEFGAFQVLLEEGREVAHFVGADLEGWFSGPRSGQNANCECDELGQTHRARVAA